MNTAVSKSSLKQLNRFNPNISLFIWESKIRDHRTNPSSGREENLNPGQPDFKFGAL